MTAPNESVYPQTNEQRYNDPVHGVIRPCDIYGPAPSGLSKREWFAGLAMQGLAPAYLEAVEASEGTAALPAIAYVSVQLADATIAALNAPTGEVVRSVEEVEE